MQSLENEIKFTKKMVTINNIILNVIMNQMVLIHRDIKPYPDTPIPTQNNISDVIANVLGQLDIPEEEKVEIRSYTHTFFHGIAEE